MLYGSDIFYGTFFRVQKIHKPENKHTKQQEREETSIW